MIWVKKHDISWVISFNFSKRLLIDPILCFSNVSSVIKRISGSSFSKWITAPFGVLAILLALQEDAPCAGHHIDDYSWVGNISQLLLCAQRVATRFFGNLGKKAASWLFANDLRQSRQRWCIPDNDWRYPCSAVFACRDSLLHFVV